jgi:hypothetical protein
MHVPDGDSLNAMTRYGVDLRSEKLTVLWVNYLRPVGRPIDIGDNSLIN